MTLLSKAIFFFTPFFVMNVLFGSMAFGVMPLEFYEKAAQSSAIKAIAVVEDVIVVQETNRSSLKKAIFRRERAFHKGIPQKFTGSCYSVDHKCQEPGVGGTIHYYPQRGSRVLVTVSSDGGSITSYTRITSQLEKEFNENG